jgi:[ribosomal protein S18]-alanine N-acetyltransferase
MSALLDNLLQYRRMDAGDLGVVIAIENDVYPHPWTPRNFSDSLDAGYECWIMQCAAEIVGYSVVMTAVGEAHLLNLSIAAGWQRRGCGREMLNFLVGQARERHACKMYLEVRPSNIAGRRLYTGFGFREIATRRGYYPASRGREDAIVMELELN